MGFDGGGGGGGVDVGGMQQQQPVINDNDGLWGMDGYDWVCHVFFYLLFPTHLSQSLFLLTSVHMVQNQFDAMTRGPVDNMPLVPQVPQMPVHNVKFNLSNLSRCLPSPFLMFYVKLSNGLTRMI